MIIELQNFGPIKSFKFDTDKDIHAIFGKNNIGKSYAISAVYLILKNLKKYRDETDLYLRNDTEEIVKNFEKTQTKKGYNFNTEIVELLKESLNNSFLSLLNNSLKNSFDFTNITNIKTNDSSSILIDFEVYKFYISFDKIKQVFYAKNITLKHDYILQHSDNEIHPTKNKNRLIYYSNKNYPQIKNLDTIVFYFHESLREGMANLYEDIYVLPASRSGLYNALNSFGAIFAELSRNRNFITRKIEIPSISEPISDYFLNLNTISNTTISNTYTKKFKQIEQDILKGSIIFDNETKKYFYLPANSEMRLELSSTSSMISEIAPIIAHLKYIIPLDGKTPSILFIEEPEAHLHPEIQILLLEYFVKLSKGNLKIVMTSHSNYIFNKLSNLVIAKEISPDRLSVSLMKMTPEGSVVEEGAMQMDEYGIEDNNFVDVAEQLYEERMQLLENINP